MTESFPTADADGFPVATADNEGTLFTDDLGVVYVCEAATSDERAEFDADPETDGATHVWRRVGQANG